MNDIDPRDFGRLESEVESLKELVRAQTAAMAAMNARLDTMNTTLSEARGGWRMLLLVGGAGATVGGGLTWLFQTFGMKGHP